MRFLYKILLSVIALAAIGQSAPKGKDKSVDKPEERFRPTPDYLCAHVYKGMYSRYYLLGENWPVHENMIMNAVKKAPACLLTNWRYQEVTARDTGLVTFNCTFDLPILCQKRVQKSLNNNLGFRPAKDGGVFCPEITETPALRQLFKDIGARRRTCGWYDGPGAKKCPDGSG